jgi:hypothetical protein
MGVQREQSDLFGKGGREFLAQLEPRKVPQGAFRAWWR